MNKNRGLRKHTRQERSHLIFSMKLSFSYGQDLLLSYSQGFFLSSFFFLLSFSFFLFPSFFFLLSCASFFLLFNCLFQRFCKSEELAVFLETQLDPEGLIATRKKLEDFFGMKLEVCFIFFLFVSPFCLFACFV